MRTLLWWIIGLAVIVGGWYLWTRGNAPAASEATQTPTQGTDSNGSPSGAAPAVASAPTITYDGTSFSPASVTIKKGGAVTFTSTAGDMWVASAPHPAHTGYDGTSAGEHCAAGYAGPAPFDQCASGASFTFTFDKTGTWNYHNHFNAAAHGSITVQ